MRKFTDREKSKATDHQPNSEATSLTYSNPVYKDRQDVTVRHLQTIAEKATSKALDVKQNGNTYVTINNVYINGDFQGSASKLSLPWR
jgi:hypothetical protein